MRHPSFPDYINVDTIPKDLISRAAEAADKIKSSNIVMVVGGDGIQRELFAHELSRRLAEKFKGKKVFFVGAVSIDTPKWGEDEPYGHITVFAFADKVPNKSSLYVISRVMDLIKSGNIPILLAESVDTLRSVYGANFINYYSNLIKVVELKRVTSVVLEAI